MATLTREDGSATSHLPAIADELSALGIRLAHWPTSPEVADLLGKPVLDAEQKEAVLAGHDGYFRQLEAEAGYQTRDLIVLHPGVPELDTLLARFERCHTHDDDEVRYIVDGEGTFGFVKPDGSQVALTVQAGEYINVPKNTEHWFVLTDARRIKAVRYFTDMAGWVPRYTGSKVRL